MELVWSIILQDEFIFDPLVGFSSGNYAKGTRLYEHEL